MRGKVDGDYLFILILIVLLVVTVIVVLRPDCDYQCKLDHAEEYIRQCLDTEIYTEDECQLAVLDGIFTGE